MIRNVPPMLATKPIGVALDSLHGTHVFDTKLDGVRALLFWSGTKLRIVARSGRDITSSFPDVVAAAECFDRPMVLDCELVAGTGFQDVARREKASTARRAASLAAALPATAMVFDLLWRDGTDLRTQPYAVRRERLETLAPTWPGVLITTAYDDPTLAWKSVVEANGEGLIAKRATASYHGGRSAHWLKFKRTDTLSCVAVGYAKGRSDRPFGALTLALFDAEWQPIVVGQVGSGFSERELVDVKALVDAGASKPMRLPVIEVEVLGLTREGVLRQPVFKGVRTDIPLTNCTITQLEGLPRS